MLKITIPKMELYDESVGEFIYMDEGVLELEHSLVSISKWESKWCLPFISTNNKTTEQVIDYIKCMCLNEVDDKVINNITNDDIYKITNYINSPMTATTFSSTNNNKSNNEKVTAELIYYWMITLNIPMECQYWHLNRLLTLIRVCDIKNSPPKKMSREELLSRNAALNAARKKQLNTKG